eukprot:5041307-Amphidinium_carterae.2
MSVSRCEFFSNGERQCLQLQHIPGMHHYVVGLFSMTLHFTAAFRCVTMVDSWTALLAAYGSQKESDEESCVCDEASGRPITQLSESRTAQELRRGRGRPKKRLLNAAGNESTSIDVLAAARVAPSISADVLAATTTSMAKSLIAQCVACERIPATGLETVFQELVEFLTEESTSTDNELLQAMEHYMSNPHVHSKTVSAELLGLGQKKFDSTRRQLAMATIMAEKWLQ